MKEYLKEFKGLLANTTTVSDGRRGKNEAVIM
jgi:hypothetical protein